MATQIVAGEKTRGRGETRITRGLNLYRNHSEEIADIGDDFYLVPSKSDPGKSYLVDLENGVCGCGDYTERLAKLPAPMACIHEVAATLYRAKGGGGEWSPSPRACRRAAA